MLELDDARVAEAVEYATLPDFRVRVLPVLGTLPAIFGMVLATHIILKLANFPIEPLPIKLRTSVYQRLHKELMGRENRLYNLRSIPLTVKDVAYIFEEIWRGRSAVSGSLEKPVLTRWDKKKPVSSDNVVCLTRMEADEHDSFDGNLKDKYPQSEFPLTTERELFVCILANDFDFAPNRDNRIYRDAIQRRQAYSRMLGFSLIKIDSNVCFLRQ